VINPYNEDEYLLGIMLDGDSYRRSANTKDREVAQINVLSGLGWNLHRMWTMDWWDNREKELAKLVKILEEKKIEAFDRKKKAETFLEIRHERFEFNVEIEEQEHVEPSSYVMKEYKNAEIPVTPMSSAEYVEKAAMKQITERLQQIIDEEAPIAASRLIRKVLRSFGISRTTPAVLEATEKALKKVSCKAYRQNGVKFYHVADEALDAYHAYRLDVISDDRRGLDEICLQELKNAVCLTLQIKGGLTKDDLLRETIRTMGYTRSRTALTEAVTAGLKYGLKTGEIAADAMNVYHLQ